MLMQLGVLLPMRLEILFLYILHNQRVFWHPLAGTNNLTPYGTKIAQTLFFLESDTLIQY